MSSNQFSHATAAEQAFSAQSQNTLEALIRTDEKEISPESDRPSVNRMSGLSILRKKSATECILFYSAGFQ